MPSSHGQQKQREKQKKKREAARKDHVARPAFHGLGPQAIIRQAALLPVGPSFISADWEEADPAQPRLVSVLITRKAPGRILVPAIVLVDRTCLGVKNSFVAKPMFEAELPALLGPMGSTHPGGMVPCDWLVAQSVVLHAVDYARSLGFAPHRDFPEPLFEPRPAALLDTPLSRPARPVYVAGPSDVVARVIERLDAAVGRDNYDFTILHDTLSPR
jgi:hypothetical protein